MGFEIAFATDQGKKNNNQDSLICMQAKTSIGNVIFAAVCDGMGGLAKGELASAVVVRRLERWFSAELPGIIREGISEDRLFASWRAIVSEVNSRLIEYERMNNVELGTTLCGLLIAAGRFYVVHIGDSRIYAVTENDITCLTKDHTLVMNEVDMGRLRLEDMEKDPRRSVLTQCVGAMGDCNPDLFSGQVYTGTVFLVCSDGFRHLLSYEEIQSQMRPTNQNSQEEMTYNLQRLIEENLQRGERDNITAIAVKV